MIPKQKYDDELIEECELKRKIMNRGYAFVQIQLTDGEWATIRTIGSYKSAQNIINTMQADMTKRNRRVYHFKVR